MEKLLTEKEVSSLLSVSRKTLQCWRWRQEGPNYRKLGRLVRYALADIEEFVAERSSRGGK